MQSSIVSGLVALFVVAMIGGCGSPGPTMTEEEVKQKVDEHAALMENMAAKYKKGGAGAHKGGK
jgi:hypothetical protein